MPELSQPIVAEPSRIAETVEAAAQFYREVLAGPRGFDPRRFLRGRGLGEEIVERFGVGYAPIGWTGVIDHLRERDYGLAEIEAAGLAARSHRLRDRSYDRFRSRLMFPIREPGLGLVGFAALATHPGPSWPRWLTSPNGPRFRAGAAVFGLDQAAVAIGQGAEPVVLNDCAEVLDHHQRGRTGAVAVIRTRLTPEHRRKLQALRPPDPTKTPGRPGRRPAAGLAATTRAV